MQQRVKLESAVKGVTSEAATGRLASVAPASRVSPLCVLFALNANEARCHGTLVHIFVVHSLFARVRTPA